MCEMDHPTFVQEFLRCHKQQFSDVEVICRDGMQSIQSRLILALLIPILENLEEFWSPNFDPVLMLPDESVNNVEQALEEFLSSQPEDAEGDERTELCVGPDTTDGDLLPLQGSYAEAVHEEVDQIQDDEEFFTLVFMSQKKKPLKKLTKKHSHKCTACPICKTVIAARGLEKHIRTHAKPFACQHCGMRFAAEQIRVKHEINAHNGSSNQPSDKKLAQSLLTCQFCRRAFVSKSHLATHLSSHDGQKRFFCGQCQRRFSTASNLKAHRKIHEGTHKRFACPFEGCGRKFSHPSEVKQHQGSHTGVNKYGCQHCGKNYRRHSGLWTHLKKCPLNTIGT